MLDDDPPPPPAPVPAGSPLQPPPPAPDRLDERLPGNGASGSDEEAGGAGGRPPLRAAPESLSAELAGARGSERAAEPTPPPQAGAGEERRPSAAADQPTPAKPKGGRLGRLFGRGRSASRSPSKLAKGHYVSAEVCGSICSPRYPERGLKKEKTDKKAADDRKKAKERERKPRSESVSSATEAARGRVDRVPFLISAKPERAGRRADDRTADWQRGPARREKYNFSCDTTLPAFLPNVSSGYDSGNDSGIGLRKSQKKRKAAESAGYESALPASECSSLESSQESEEEPRLNRKNGQVQAGQCTQRPRNGVLETLAFLSVPCEIGRARMYHELKLHGYVFLALNGNCCLTNVLTLNSFCTYLSSCVKLSTDVNLIAATASYRLADVCSLSRCRLAGTQGQCST